jgi:gliding motility-associated lipoprotein GldH
MIKGPSNTIFLLSVSLLLLIAGCRNNVVYTDSTAFPSGIWKIDNIAEFKPDISDTAAIRNIFFTIRTGASYPFRNIWLFVNTISPSGKSITDTLQYMLADEKGKWYGRGFGDLRELDLPFRSGIWFPEKGMYRFRITHGMRTVDLKGVEDIGLRIEKAKK